MTRDDKLDRLLVQHFRNDAATATDDHGAAARVMATLGPLPSQGRHWRHWPAVLLNWEFAPAWPRVAALVGCAALGFAVGVVGQSLHRHDTSSTLAPRGDFQFASLLAEPEPMTGVLP
jgi:hypothetical protein